jgi:excisionase family DNA binding protein
MEQLLNYNQLSERLGVSRRTVEFWVSARKIPFIKLGEKNSSVRFALNEVENWLRSKRVNPICLQ